MSSTQKSVKLNINNRKNRKQITIKINF